ncbi:MAG: transporter substrate-binding domain-containing protein, partial [Acidaminobacteraceae bacterium]
DIYYNESRANYLLYDSQPFISYPTVIFKKSDFDFKFTGDLNELRSYRIGYVRDYSLGPLDEYKVRDGFNFFASSSNKKNFENLSYGRIDLAIDVKSTGENIIASLDISDEISIVNPPIFSEYSYIVFSKKNELEVLLEEYEYALKTMREDGTLKELYKKYNLEYFDFNNN